MLQDIACPVKSLRSIPKSGYGNGRGADINVMKLILKKNREIVPRKTERCAYIKCCYLAETLDCYGYKADCILYIKSNDRFFTRQAFDAAVNSLIDKTKVKHDLLQVK